MDIVHRIGNIEYLELDNVYPVSEDTLFLLGKVKDHLEMGKGKIMDMGCGVGLITLFASSLGWEVISVDREPKALENVRYNISLNNLNSDLYLSNLFEGIPRILEGSFDLISFNPPYLPQNNIPLDRRSDLALVGGVSGSEIASKFLEQVPKFLKHGGKVLLLAYEDWSSRMDMGSKGFQFDTITWVKKDIDGEKFVIMELTKK